MDFEERKLFGRWVDTNPHKPVGMTYLELWNAKKKEGDLTRWMN